MTGRQFLAIAASIAFVATTAPPSIAAQGSGITYTFVMQVHVTDSDGKTTDGITMRGHASMLGDQTRIDFDSLNGQLAGIRGGYFLVLNGGNRVVLVAPKAKRYLEMPMQLLAQHFTKLTTGADGFVDRHATDVHVDAVAMGAGPTLFRHSTTHYRLVDVKTINAPTNTERDSIVNDLYYAPDLKNFINPFLSYAPAMAAGMGMYGPAYDQQYMAARANLYQGGAPLRTVSDFTITVDSGKRTRVMLTTEVTQLGVADVDASVFDLPADYAKQTIGLSH